MLGNPISAKVIVALALAVLMAWVGHTSALVTGTSQLALSGNESAHSHTHGNDVFACAACSDHYHSSLTADHVHETPHLATLLALNAQPERAALVRDPGYFIATAPVFLIKRPPRSELLR